MKSGPGSIKAGIKIPEHGQQSSKRFHNPNSPRSSDRGDQSRGWTPRSALFGAPEYGSA